MALEIPAHLWKRATSTVGLVSVRHDHGVNVMSAEWSSFVNKEPLYVAVVLGPQTATRELVAARGEFAVTLCSEQQAELADFAGSFSLGSVDKTSSELVAFGTPEATGTPWVEGGLLAVECVLREVVPFPVHRMYVGEVVAAHFPAVDRRPLVKHGAMHALGDPIARTSVVAAVRAVDGDVLRVAATGPAAVGDDVWRVTLLTADDVAVDLGAHPSGTFGDLLVDLPLPAGSGPLAGARVRVERDGAKPGYARFAAGIR